MGVADVTATDDLCTLDLFVNADNFHLAGDVSEEQTEFQINAETMLGTITFLD